LTGLARALIVTDNQIIDVGQVMEQSEVQALADKLDKLIERCEKLEKDNALLRELQDDWNRERAQLMHKNDLAKHKIEAMIGRLRALEHH
jgi:cell division protein ZapB